jgi:hypothetical protein
MNIDGKLQQITIHHKIEFQSHHKIEKETLEPQAVPAKKHVEIIP